MTSGANLSICLFQRPPGAGAATQETGTCCGGQWWAVVGSGGLWWAVAGSGGTAFLLGESERTQAAPGWISSMSAAGSRTAVRTVGLQHLDL